MYMYIYIYIYICIYSTGIEECVAKEGRCGAAFAWPGDVANALNSRLEPSTGRWGGCVCV